jgi:hypothetical protein
MDPQASQQPTWDNVLDFIYPLEHDPKWMTRGARADRTKRSCCTYFTKPADPQPSSNRLRDQITNARYKTVKIGGPVAPRGTTAPLCWPLHIPLVYKYPLLQPSTQKAYI